MPWSTRAAIRVAPLGANPHPAEARANQITPIEKMRRRPSRSPSDPPSRRKAARVKAYPVMTHCNVPSSAWNERPMEGSAIPTTVLSRVAMPDPRTDAAMTHRAREVPYTRTLWPSPPASLARGVDPCGAPRPCARRAL